MKLRLCPLLAGISLTLAFTTGVESARRPRYGGTLRMEIGATVNSLDPAVASANPAEAAAKAQIDALIYERQDPRGTFSGSADSGPFRVSNWEPGRRVLLAANEDFAAGRPFADAIDIQMGRSRRDRLLDLELGSTDLAEISPEQARVAADRGVRVTNSRPDELLALVFLPGRSTTKHSKVREALARAIDRGPIVNFILQKDGEPAGGLLPQWSSGTAFLFSIAADAAGAKEMWSQIASPPRLMLGYDSGDTLEQSIAERIVVNAREAGIFLTTQSVAAAPSAKVDARLVRLQMASPDPRIALSNFLNVLGPIFSLDSLDARALPEPATPIDIYRRERAIVSDHRLVPIVWLPHVYGLSARVRDWTPPDAGAAWPLADVWLDGEQQ